MKLWIAAVAVAVAGMVGVVHLVLGVDLVSRPVVAAVQVAVTAILMWDSWSIGVRAQRE